MGRVEGVVLERGRVLAGGHLCREVGARLVILFRMHVAKKIILSCISTPFSLTITSNVQNNPLPPLQMNRAFGCDAAIGLIYSINPLTIVFLVPVVGAMTTGDARGLRECLVMSGPAWRRVQCGES